MKKKSESSVKNAKIAIIFFIFLALIIGVSLILKVVMLIKASQFNDSRRFTLTISNGRNAEVISLSPKSKNIAVFKLKDGINPSDAGRLLEIPIDGFITSDFLNLDQNANSLFLNAIFKYNNLKTNLTIVDFLKLAMIARTIPESSIEVRTVSNTNALELDKIVGRLVRDAFIEKDNQTIQIVNGTDVSGLGNRLARLITNMGGDIIIVVTGDRPIKKSMISYIDKKTYTVEKLQKVLGYDTVRQTSNAISDITIIIGEDGVNSAPF